MGKKVAVGLSGGVDSAVTAHLLQQAGHEVIGVTSINYAESRCCDARSVLEAKRVAEFLGFPYHTIDVILQFKQKVVERFKDGYKAGLTPNPCTICNAEVRFEELFDEAEWRYGVEAIATGHYARVRRDPETGRYQLLRGKDPTKDQSYMLYRLDQRQLSRVIFPLGEMTKAETRAIAEALGLSVAKKPDSQDVCFVMGDTVGFLQREIGDQLSEGAIVDLEGHVLGTHQGIAYYTVGQRKGLGLTSPQPLYVVRLEPATNTVVVGPREAVFIDTLTAGEVNWVSWERPAEPFRAEVQIRYRTAPAPALVTPTEEGIRIDFDEGQFAASPGQVAAVYVGEVLVCGGVIAPTAP
ncbi:MAG TPA: tRNA 2-thiouridine(34) synthase MnmA [Stenomitos sp.]